MDRARSLSVQQSPGPAQPIRDRGTLEETCEDRNWRGNEDGDEVSELLQAVVAGPAFIHGESKRQILQRGRGRIRKPVPGARAQPQPLARPEQQGVNDDAVYDPEQPERKMPPTSKPDRVPNA